MDWKKSSYSGQEGNCVETSLLPDGGRAIRDSKDKDGPVLRVTSGEWKAFLGKVKGQATSD